MRRIFVTPDQVSGDTVTVTGGDVNHIKNVLRMAPGDELLISAGGLGTLRCALRTLERDEITAKILERGIPSTEPDVPVVLLQGLPKGDKMELVIQKAVELGATRIIPVSMKHCVMRLTPERAENRVRRWQAIAESAAKQAGRDAVPTVELPLSFDQALSLAGTLPHRLLAYENASGMDATRAALARCRDAGGGICLLVGPEGGVAPEEVTAAQAAGFTALSLGRRILRTETAALALLSMLNYVLEP